MEFKSISFKLNDFEGPLDLLLHLISKNKLNIYDICLVDLVDQYIGFINQSQQENMDVASEFLEMAARLIYLKSVSLLPKHEEAEELKAGLQGELIEYQICKQMAQLLSERTDGFKMFVREPVRVDADKTYKRTHNADLLIKYYGDAAGRGLRKLPPDVTAFSGIVHKKIVSVSSGIVTVLRKFKHKNKVRFEELFSDAESKSEVIATFLAVLELLKNKRIQTEEKNGEIIINYNDKNTAGGENGAEL